MSKAVIEHFGPKVPVLGVCLGHQSIAEVYSGRVIRADRLMHGKVSPIYHDSQGVFAGLKSPFIATRYHSLIVPEDSLGEDLEICAWTEDPGRPREMMGFRHRKLSGARRAVSSRKFSDRRRHRPVAEFLKTPRSRAAV